MFWRQWLVSANVPLTSNWGVRIIGDPELDVAIQWNLQAPGISVHRDLLEAKEEGRAGLVKEREVLGDLGPSAHEGGERGAH